MGFQNTQYVQNSSRTFAISLVCAVVSLMITYIASIGGGEMAFPMASASVNAISCIMPGNTHHGNIMLCMIGMMMTVASTALALM